MKGKKGYPLPKEHSEKSMSQLKTSNGKYASEMGAPEELEASTAKLAEFVKKNKPKR